MITRVLKGQWPIPRNILTAGRLREIVRELDDHGISGGVEIEAYGHDGEVKVLAGMRFQKDLGTPPIEMREDEG